MQWSQRILLSVWPQKQQLCCTKVGLNFLLRILGNLLWCRLATGSLGFKAPFDTVLGHKTSSPWPNSALSKSLSSLEGFGVPKCKPLQNIFLTTFLCVCFFDSFWRIALPQTVSWTGQWWANGPSNRIETVDQNTALASSCAFNVYNHSNVPFTETILTYAVF